jgi:hypothetical protein
MEREHWVVGVSCSDCIQFFGPNSNYCNSGKSNRFVQMRVARAGSFVEHTQHAISTHENPLLEKKNE